MFKFMKSKKWLKWPSKLIVLAIIASLTLPNLSFAEEQTWDLSDDSIFTVSNDYTAEITDGEAHLIPDIFVKETLAAISGYNGLVFDADGDTDLDIYVVSVATDADNQLLINDGTGSFTPTTITGEITAQQTDNVIVADFDGDTNDDLYLGNINTFPDNRIWLGDGIGGFTNSNQANDSGSTLGTAAADLDGDGDLDIVTGNYIGSPNQVYINQGNDQEGVEGEFLASDLEEFDGDPAAYNQASQAIAIGDVNGDTFPDVYVANSGSNQNRLWLNRGDGTFTASDIAGDTASLWDAAIVDIDGDLDLDIYNAVNGAINIVWINDGAGNFSSTTITGDHVDTINTVIDDVNGDGNLDIHNVGLNGTNVLFLGDGAGNYTDASIPTDSAAWSSDFGDLDGDGDTDIMTIGSSAVLGYFQGYDYNSPYIELTEAVVFGSTVDSFSHTLGVDNEGTVTYQLSTDNGDTWYYWDGEDWTETEEIDGSETSTVSDVNTNIATLDTNGGQFLWRAYLNSDGEQAVILEDVTVDATTFEYTIELIDPVESDEWENGTYNPLEFEYSCEGPSDCETIEFEFFYSTETTVEADIDPETEDCITDNVCFTMAEGEGNILSNTVQDEGFDWAMPLGTEWVESSCGDSPEELVFDTFYNVTEFDPALDTDFCMYSTEDDLYYDINFSLYGLFGGSTIYTRTGLSEISVPTEEASPFYTESTNPATFPTVEGGYSTTFIVEVITNDADTDTEYNFFARTSLEQAPEIIQETDSVTITIADGASSGGSNVSSGSSGSRAKSSSGDSDVNLGPTTSDDGEECVYEQLERLPENRGNGITAGKFNDLNGSEREYKYAVDLLEQDVVHGDINTGFARLDDTVNRAEAVKTFSRAASHKILTTTSCLENNFPDVIAGEWYHKYVHNMVKRDTIHGYPDGFFKPGNGINLAEVYKITAITFGFITEDEAEAQVSESLLWYMPFEQELLDRGIIPEWFADYPADRLASRGDLFALISRTLAYLDEVEI